MKNKKLLCTECYKEEYTLKDDERVEISFEKFVCSRCGEIKPVVVNVHKIK